jgi:dienelactone hydrolase
MLRNRFRLLSAFLLFLPAASTLAAAGPEAVQLTAADGVRIRGDFYRLASDEGRTAPVVLLFHQAGASRHEYTTIAPRLNELGLHALAIDQRSGGSRWGENETVARRGGSTSYLEALADLEAALSWVGANGYSGQLLVWGSSYSAALAFLLAAAHPEIDGVLAFSPGEYLGSRSDEVRAAARQVECAVLVLTPADERERAEPIFEALPGENGRFVVPEQAVHGSSMLVPARNEGAEEIWPEVVAFLEQFLPRD